MKTMKFIVLALLVAATVTTAEAKQVKAPHMYIFGFAASFVDTTLYMTDIQDVECAWYDTKEEALLGRDSYSYQLKEFLSEKKGQPNRVCLVIFSTDKKKAEKKYEKLKKKYMSKDGSIPGMQYLTVADFKFEPVEITEE